MTPPREIWQLDTTAIGRKVLVYDRVVSTNTVAAELAKGLEREPLAILAAEQTAGRGQHGRTWIAAPGSSVLLSLLLFPPDALRRPALLTAWAAVSVCETIQQLTHQRATIKWPNDVLVRGKKICGILIEQGRGTVVGIGLNVQQTALDFARAGLLATSINQIAANPLSAEHVARALLHVLDAKYGGLCLGELGALETRWNEHLCLLGNRVIAECAGVKYCGRLSELTFANIAVEQCDGVARLRPELVQHLNPAAEPGTAATGN